MKKIMILFLIAAFVGVFTAPLSVYAYTAGTSAWETGSFDVGSNTSITVRTSKNVNMTVATTGTTMPVAGYSVGAYHSTGSRTYGTSNADQKLWFYDTTKQTIQGAPANPESPPNWAGNAWKEL